MSDWRIVLIIAGSAVGAGLVTGWYTRNAAIRQASEAADTWGRQADALLESVRVVLRAESDHRDFARRQQIYAQFLGAVEAKLFIERGGQSQVGDQAPLYRTLGEIRMEGPPEVIAAAQHLVACLRRHEGQDEIDQAKNDFISVARSTRPSASP